MQRLAGKERPGIYDPQLHLATTIRSGHDAGGEQVGSS